MKRRVCLGAFIFTLLFGLTVAQAENMDANRATALEEIVVVGEPIEGFDKTVIDPHVCPIKSNRDTSALLRGVPGANFNYNGSLGAQAQYRGLFGARINVAVDGKTLNPACPNWMDPPLHYISQSNLDSLEVVRGIAPVSSGIETFGATILAYSQKSRFTDTEDVEFHGSVEVGGASANASLSSGNFLSLSNNKHRAHLLTSTDIGNDLSIPDGTLVQTRYEQYGYGIGYGYRLEKHEFGFGYNRSRTDEAGTPALPMDNIISDMDSYKGSHHWYLGNAELKTDVFYSEMDHRMDNFTMRQSPILSKYRVNNADSSSGGLSMALSNPLKDGIVTIGVDGNLSENTANITNPNNSSFLVKAFNNTTQNKYSVFSEWNGQVRPDVNLTLGLRYTHVTADADRVAGPMAPPAVRLADTFNASSREKRDDNVDWHLQFNHALAQGVDWELGFARKSRSPSFLERYAWIPLDASAGLSDGNTYVGNLNLDPEISHQVEVGVNIQKGLFTFTPRVFYRHIDDYMQGTPTSDADVVAVSSGGGDPTPLRFSNVDAELYGLDFGWQADLNKNWILDGSFSYVRGKRRDISDNLYRVSPPNGTMGLTYRQTNWSLTTQGVFAAKQNDVSMTNGEFKTSGYGLMNLFGTWHVRENFSISAGIENVFDKFYRDHLSGINRVNGSDIDLGLKLPGAGRNFFLSCSLKW